MKTDIEIDFIRDCLASKLFLTREFPTPPAKLDWERFALLLSGSRLSAYFSVLGSGQKNEWSSAFLEKLRGDRYSLMFYGDQCSIHIRVLLSALDEAEIPVIVFKGWAYITTIYGGDYSLRVCEDIDILVCPRDVDLVEKVLEDLDFRLEMEGWEGYNRRYLNGARYFVGGRAGLPGSTFSIGLHWGLWHTPYYDPLQVDIDALFARAHSLKIAGENALSFSVEDHIIYACAHLALHHRFDDSLFRYYELAFIILNADSEIDWGIIVERAKEWRVILSVIYVLKRTESLWQGVVPLDVIENLERLSPSSMEKFTVRWVIVTRGRPAFDHFLTWITFPDWKERVLIALQDIFPSPAYMIERYGKAPGGLWILLYFRRFFYAIGFLFK